MKNLQTLAGKNLNTPLSKLRKGLTKSEYESVKAFQSEMRAKRQQREKPPQGEKSLNDRIKALNPISIAEHLPDSGYSMGEVKEVVVLNNVMQSYDNTRQYAGRCTWRAKHGSVAVSLTPKEYKNTKIIGGLVTIIGEKVKKDTYKCKWVKVTGKGHLPEFVEGYIYKDYHFTNILELKTHKSRLKFEKQQTKALKRNDKVTFVDFNDSITDRYNNKNCIPGTENFIQKIGFTAAAIRADILRQLGAKFNLTRYVEKAIFNAKMRYSNL